MNEIIFGTTNPAKIAQVQGALTSLDVSVKGVEEFLNELPEVAEDSNDPVINARHKAQAYARALNCAVLSMDNALYFEGLAKEHQPGARVRRFPGATVERPSDEDVLRYYADKVEKLGGSVDGQFDFAVCVAWPDAKISETVISTPRKFVSRVSNKMTPGYPLESIQVDPATNMYVSEMTQEQQGVYWQSLIGRELAEFIKKNFIND